MENRAVTRIYPLTKQYYRWPPWMSAIYRVAVEYGSVRLRSCERKIWRLRGTTPQPLPKVGKAAVLSSYQVTAEIDCSFLAKWNLRWLYWELCTPIDDKHSCLLPGKAGRNDVPRRPRPWKNPLRRYLTCHVSTMTVSTLLNIRC
jgi:hypothetical protein